MGSWHEVPLRVRFEETDTMGVVYYAKFLVWFEVGRMSLLRDVGLPYKDWSAKEIGFPVVRVRADYHAPARFDDEILVKTRVSRMGNTSLTFENEVYKQPKRELLCTGHTIHVLVGGDGKPVRIPDELRAKISS
jgi:acyl-CoA thioester hydrolase